jgi:hypothetical protein
MYCTHGVSALAAIYGVKDIKHYAWTKPHQNKKGAISKNQITLFKVLEKLFPGHEILMNHHNVDLQYPTQPGRKVEYDVS